MDGQRIEHAVQRIEAALRRIAAAADEPRPASPAVSELVVQHERLRETVGGALAEIDSLIEKARTLSEVRLMVGGREYTVACAEGEEAHVTRLGEAIDDKLQQMGGNLSPKEAQNLLFAALLLADDLHEATARTGDADGAQEEIAQARADADTARAGETAARTELENLRGEHQALTGELEKAREAADSAGTWQGDPDLPPALERFADLLENCADKLEGKAPAS